MRAGALRDIAPLFREERRSRPSKTGNFAGFLIDIFHINRRAAAIDAPETLPDISAVDGPEIIRRWLWEIAIRSPPRTAWKICSSL
jgi:hypothetical protein